MRRLIRCRSKLTRGSGPEPTAATVLTLMHLAVVSTLRRSTDRQGATP
jgi:hypothetical protein